MRTKDEAKRIGNANLPDPPVDSSSEEEEASDSPSSKSNQSRSGEVSESASSERDNERNKSSNSDKKSSEAESEREAVEAESEREAVEAELEREAVEATERTTHEATESEGESGSSKETAAGSVEADEIPIGVMPPLGMYIKKDQYPKSIKVATRCYVASAVEEIEKRLDRDEMNWFRDHPQFKHFFHMPRDKTHKSMGMWTLILRMARTMKKKELWFLVNGVPIRYSMREHCLISGLFCDAYPRGYKRFGNLKLVEKYFPGEPKVTQEMVEQKFLSMRTRKENDERLKMAVLYFLTQVIKGSAKRGKDAPNVDPLLQRIVMDLDKCRVFPWGRYTFLDTLIEVERMVALFIDGVVNANCNLPCFIVPLELLAFEAIPSLGNYFRKDVDNADKRCPRMCKRKFKSWSLRGFPIEEIYKQLGETTEIDSILQATLEERHLLADMVPEDDDVDAVVDGWTNRLTVEDQPVFFEELLREDLEMRTVVVEDEEEEEEEAEEEAPVDETSDGPSGGVLSQREFQEVLLAELNALNQKVDESRDIMVAGLKEIKEDMKSLSERVTGVENFVSDFRMDGDLPNVINLSQGQGRYDPLGDSFNILATAASKVTEKRVEEGEGQVGKGGEVDKEKDVSGGKDVSVEEDRRDKKNKKGKKQRKKKAGEKNSTHVEEDQVEKVQEEEEVQDKINEEQAKTDEVVEGEKKQKKRKTHSALTKPPYGRPNTRQKTTTEGTTQ